MVPKVKCSRRSSALGETQRKWTEKLKRVSLDDFIHVCTFSKGAFSHVNLVQLAGHPESAFALKTMQKAKIKRKHAKKSVLRERKLLSEIDSDFVVKLYKTFKDKKNLYLLTEYCPGGDMYRLNRLSKKSARFYIACVVEAIDALHSQNIVHNDLKPANLVLDEIGYLKVIDLGLAMKLERDKLAFDNSGTVDYLPPEVIRSDLNPTETPQGRDRSVDLWATGVTLYELVRGISPFQDEENIMRGIENVQFSKRYFSDEAKDLIQKLCSYDPRTRLGYGSIDEIRQHPFFLNFDWNALRKRELQPPIVPKLKSAIDTQNFKNDVKVKPESDVEVDESDWDLDF